MEQVGIVEATREHTVALASFCVPTSQRQDPIFQQGIRAKQRWLRQKWDESQPVAKLAYLGDELVGILQYEIHPLQGTTNILCLFVPEQGRKGIASRLLAALVKELRQRPIQSECPPVKALTTYTFPGEGPEQRSAREFFRRKGFQPLDADPDQLLYPLVEGFRPPSAEPGPCYFPQPEDLGRVLFLAGPNFCPFAYPFRVWAQQALAQIAPQLPVRWIDTEREPAEMARRGDVQGVIVNGCPVHPYPPFGDDWVQEVRHALSRPTPLPPRQCGSP